MNRRIVGLAVAGVLALFGTGLLVAYVQSAHNNAGADSQMSPVLVAQAPIAKGTPANTITSSVRVVQLPASARAAGSMSSLASLGQKVTGSDIVPGEQIIASRFVDKSPVAAAADGKLQVTVSLGAER